MLKTTIGLASLFLMSACAVSPVPKNTLYEAIGGHEKLVEITDNFLKEVSFDESLYVFFEKSNIPRFKEKWIEYLCVRLDGPCTYTGDSMTDVHAGKNINESVFNHTVDILTKAMTQADLDYPLQNKVLARLISTREDMLYK
jgi:hemoglobin